MARLTSLMLSCLLIAPAMAQEDAWQKFLKEQQEYTNKRLSEANAKVEAAQQATLDSAKGIRNPIIAPAQPQPISEVQIKTFKSLDQPTEDPKTKAYLVNTPGGMKQCRFVAGIAFCS